MELAQEDVQVSPRLGVWWRCVHGVGVAAIVVLIVQGVRLQDCALGDIVENGAWGPFSGRGRGADDVADALFVAYLVIGVVTWFVVLPVRVATTDTFESAVVRSLVANGVVGAGVLVVFVVFSVGQHERAVFCTPWTFVVAGGLVAAVAGAARFVNRPPAARSR